MTRTVSRLLLAAALAACAGVAERAAAEIFPARPITIVVPYPAGGITDALVRLLGDRMKETLGQPIVIENLGGGAGTIGVGRVTRATPDGYTLVLGNVETTVLAAKTMTIPYDVVADLEPVALLPSYPFLLVTTNDVPAKDLKELAAWIKANPQKVLQGIVGAGTMQQLCGLSLQTTLGAKWQFVPYRGGTPAMQDMLAGQINFMCTATGSFLPLVRNGQIRAYAVTANRRMESAPEIPTVDEAGLPGLYASVWNALWAPKDTPKDIVAKLNTAVTQAMAESAIRNRIVEMGLDMPGADERTPDALRALQKADIEKWWPIIKNAGLKAE
jgi:tripartite-type tricarboxylate transporter receptor subunit TctC